jgi:hypothetical protein
LTDEKGNILGISEIRSRLISGEPLKTVHVGRSSLKNAWVNFSNFIEGADYLWYLKKNIFKIRCQQYSMFNQDSRPIREYYELIPDGYKEELLSQSEEPQVTSKGKKIFPINDEDLLWQKPAGSSY